MTTRHASINDEEARPRLLGQQIETVASSTGTTARHALECTNTSSQGYATAGRRNSHWLLRRRRYDHPLFRAPRTGDGRHALAGLLAHGSNALARLPDSCIPSRLAPFGTSRAVALGPLLAADSCGGSRGFEPLGVCGLAAVTPNSHRVPFSSGGARTPSEPSRTGKEPELCRRVNCLRRLCRRLGIGR